MPFQGTTKMKIIECSGFEEKDIVFSEAEIGDADLLYQAEKECFESDPWSEGMFRDALENSSCRIYILSDMQMTKIVAYAVMYTCLDEADLANIAVIPSMRKRGLGAALLDKVMEKAVNTGVERVFLEVRETNTPAKSLYLSKGFEQIGIRKKYYRDPLEDAHIMMWCREGK